MKMIRNNLNQELVNLLRIVYLKRLLLESGFDSDRLKSSISLFVKECEKCVNTVKMFTDALISWQENLKRIVEKRNEKNSNRNRC